MALTIYHLKTPKIRKKVQASHHLKIIIRESTQVNNKMRIISIKLWNLSISLSLTGIRLSATPLNLVHTKISTI